MAEQDARPGSPEASGTEEPTEEQPRPPRLESAGGQERSALGDAFAELLRGVLRRGRVEVERAAEGARYRLDLRQLRRDRDVMYQKLGREVRALLEGGELQHPGLARGLARIRELEQRIAEVEESGLRVSEPEAGPEQEEP